MNLSRRALLQSFSIAGAACALSRSQAGGANSGPEQDWQWLVGNWDVWHERLRERLAGSTTWDEFAGKSNCWLMLGGLGTIDDNLLYLPSGKYRAVGVRAFDPAARTWAIWWLDGRKPQDISPSLSGTFIGGVGTLTGEDVVNGQPVRVRSQWTGMTRQSAYWEQALSRDGKTWEAHWIAELERAG